MRKLLGGILAAIVLVFVLSLVFGSWYRVDQGERVVVLRTGAVRGVSEPGLHFKLPILDGIVRFPIQTQSVVYEKLQAYSQDQQPADIQMSVTWRLPADKVADAYAEFGSLANLQARLIDRRVPQAMKTVFGGFTAVTAIQHRAELNTKVADAIKAALDGDIFVESIQIENIDFSDAYEQSVESRMLTEVEVQKRQQELAQKRIEAQITVTAAQAQADSQLAVARANAEATRIQGEATASAIKVRGDALRENPGLVSLTAAERWDGKLPSTMLPGATVPFVKVEP